ncbi:MAG: SulP family inorganic anion transporter [Ilumatobacteraceae bacterium]
MNDRARAGGPATSWLPGWQQARHYERAWLSRDVAAGLVLTGLLAPAGMAYAAAAGLPPVNGLYASIIPLFVYAAFGPSRIMVLGPDSALTPLIAAAILPALAAGGSGVAVDHAAMLAILAGVLCAAAGIARFGFIAELLSAPVRYGYLHGIAITIIVGQTAKLCGFSVPGESLLGQLDALFTGLRDGLFNGWAMGIGLACLALILVIRSFSRAVPATLVAVVVGIVASVALDLEAKGVPVVGDMPRGIPLPSWPDLDWNEVQRLFGAALGVAFVAFADTSVLSRAMAVRRHERVDSNRELVALGLSNVASGLFQGFPISSSSSRTPVAEASGARTQLTGVVAALAMIVIAFAVPGIFRHMPDATLAAIVMAAAFSLIDIPALTHLYRVRRSEFTLAIAAMVAVALLGPVTGAVVAVGLSILNFLRLAWKPHTAELVRVDGLKGYHDLARHPEGRRVPGLLLYRFDAPLFFANARFFQDDLVHRIATREDDDPVRCVIVTAEPITDVDATAAEMLRDLLEELDARHIELRFAELKGTVHERVDRYQVFEGRMPEHTARTTGQAVKAYLTAYRVTWVDWEDHSP